MNIPEFYTGKTEIDHIKIFARPTNLKKSQYIAKLHKIGSQLIYYDFDTPHIICDKIEYTIDFFDKKFNLMKQKRINVNLTENALARINAQTTPTSNINISY